MQKDKEIPCLSVIMPCRNHARYLPEALEALSTQERPPDELILIDDASEDATPAIIRAFARESPIQRIVTIHHRDRRGVVASMREGVAMARSSYVYCAASDDRVLPGLFARSLAMLQTHPTAGLCSSLIRCIGPDGEDLGEPIWCGPHPSDCALAPADVLAQMLQGGPWFYGNTTIWRTEALLAVGGFREALGPYCDGFAAQAVALLAGACYVHAVLACWRRMPDSYSARMAADDSLTRLMYATAACVMSCELAWLFPPEYRAVWRRRVGLEVTP